MTPLRTGLAVAGLVLGMGSAVAEAQAPTETRGAWRIAATEQGFALLAQAADAPDTSFGLACRKEIAVYAFEISSPALKSIPRGEDVRIALQFGSDDPVRFVVAAGANGVVQVIERVHHTAFVLVLSSLNASTAQHLTVSAGEHQWRFSPEGFAALVEPLKQRCGFAPSGPSMR